MSLAIFLVASLFAVAPATAQVGHGGTPVYNHSSAKITVPEVELGTMDNDVFIQEDMTAVRGAGPMRVGIMQNVEINVLEQSKKIADARGVRYIMMITSPDASFVSLYFSKYKVPEGAELFFYTADGDVVIGSFNASNALDDGTFYTQALPGQSVYVEYFVPDGENPGELLVSDVCHGYKDIFGSMNATLDNVIDAAKGAHGSAEGNCHINVACRAADDWQDQVRSVVAINIMTWTASYMCSGALINNTRQDRTPYVLSAFHCQDLQGVRGFTTYFLYQTRMCSLNSGPSTNSVVGADIIAKGSYSLKSDFLLLKLRDTVPFAYTPYFAGWDRNTVMQPTLGACIHHPGGDYKKISFPSSVVRGGSYYRNFYMVNWYTGSENKGVTEEGSSGSPLFNGEKRIIGQLFAGSSSCDEPDGVDVYGRLTVSWNNDNNRDSSLYCYLDPDNTGVTTLDGLDYNTPATSIADVGSANDYISVYPNPASGVVRFDVDAIGDANYKVFDAAGHCVLEGRTILTATVQAVDLSALPAGVYTMRLFTASKGYSAKIVKSK